MIKHFGVTPYLVFDGDFLPSKARTEASRAKRREDSRKAGLELLRAGKPAQAQLELQKAIDVTPEMARYLIEELKREGIPYVVAPYEADAQLVYLERHGYTNGIISEDSDLLVFGAKRLLTKMDQHGQCIEINRKDFCAVREISLTGWTDEQFRQMAIFSGCDYLESIGNMGLKTAYRMMRKYKTPERVIRMLQFDGKFRVSENYLAQYKQAELTFLYQRVFCPEKKQLVLLTEPQPSLPLDLEEMPYIGARVNAGLAAAVATGDVNPMTKEPITIASLPEKRRTNAFTKTTRAAAVAPEPSRPTPEKPIDSYFKGHRRIPMGEMDQNCFSVDPERVAALTQNGLTPRVFPLPRPYLDDVPRPLSTPKIHRRRTEPISRALSSLDSAISSPTSQRSATRQVRRISDVEARPPKKARLCEDLTTNEDAPGGQRVKSKFFPHSATSDQRHDDADSMSDDSIDEALANLPDIDDEWKRSKTSGSQQSLQIFQDETPTEDTIPADEAETMDGKNSKVGSVLGQGIALGTKDESNQKANAAGGDTPGKTLRGMLKDFSYTPNVPRGTNGTRMAFGLPTPASSMQGSQSQTRPQPSTPTATPVRTPLQRLGAVALQRNKASSSPLTRAKSSRGAPKKRSSLAESLDSFPVNPAFVPLPKVDMVEVEALNRTVGSEDQIIPDSDEENEPPTSVANVKLNLGRQLDLSRFLYG